MRTDKKERKSGGVDGQGHKREEKRTLEVSDGDDGDDGGCGDLNG